MPLRRRNITCTFFRTSLQTKRIENGGTDVFTLKKKINQKLGEREKQSQENGRKNKKEKKKEEMEKMNEYNKSFYW